MVANEKAEAVEVAMEDMESYLRREEELEML